MKNRKSLVHQRSESDVKKSIVVEILSIRAHLGDKVAVLGERHAGLKRNFIEMKIAFVVEIGTEELVIGHEEVGESVAVEIPDRDPHPLSDAGTDSRLFRYVSERAVTVVEEKLVWKSLEEFWMTIIRCAVDLANGFV